MCSTGDPPPKGTRTSFSDTVRPEMSAAAEPSGAADTTGSGVAAFAGLAPALGRTRRGKSSLPFAVVLGEVLGRERDDIQSRVKRSKSGGNVQWKVQGGSPEGTLA